jgi:polyhydroxyalkanoate synthase
MGTDKPTGPQGQLSQPEDVAARAADGILGPNPFIGLRLLDVLASFRQIAQQIVQHPTLVVEQQAALVRDLISVLAGKSELAPGPGDKRFGDDAWKQNPGYRTYLQGYLAWTSALKGFVDRSKLDGQTKDRAQFVMSLLTDALAPTNMLLGNPAVLRKTVDTRGANLLAGVQNLLEDISTNGWMPAQVDKKAFAVGKNLALTAGAVVLRTPVLELIQYLPATETVHARPHLIVPPEINKFYVFDLSPGKSILEYLVKQGFQMFAIS